MTDFSPFLQAVEQGQALSKSEMTSAMNLIMSGDVSKEMLSPFLSKMNDRGESVSEITGAAKVMRQMAGAITAPVEAIDCCGTGGDASGTYNISTAVALVCASAGVPIAKHGNRAASSKSGAADVLEALGVNLNLNTSQLEQALKEFNFCFLMAPHHHTAMKHVMPTRKALGRRTIFNLLGPLANPAGTKKQLIGVFDEKWLRPIAETLNNLGTIRAWIVHGLDGLDEITTTTETKIVKLDAGAITEETVSPKDFGLDVASMDALKGGDAQQNAEALLSVLKGQKNAYRDIVLANASAVLNIHGSVDTLIKGVELARETIDSGKALDVLTQYATYSQEAAS